LPLHGRSVLAFFSNTGPWRERQALFGTVALFVGCYPLLWAGLAPRLGRLGAAFACAGFFAFFYPLQLAAYADTWVSLFALIAWLGLLKECLPLNVGLAALAAAAITKKEGAVLAAGTLLLWGGAQLIARRHSWRFVATAAGCVLVLPIAHRIWMAAHHFTPHPDIGSGLTWELILDRIGATYDMARSLLAPQPLWLLGLGGFTAAASWCLTRRTLGSPGLLSLSFIGWTLFVFATFALTPYPFEWHLGTALIRVASHAFCIAALAPLSMVPHNFQRNETG
jgi:hypothetical protein